MRVVSKVASGSALLFVLLAGVLLYQLHQFRSSVRDSQGLSTKQARASTIILDQLRLLDRIDFLGRRYALRQDPDYLREMEDTADDFEAQLVALDEVLSEGIDEGEYPEEPQLAVIRHEWRQMRHSTPLRLLEFGAAVPAYPEPEVALPVDTEGLAFQIQNLRQAIIDNVERKVSASQGSSRGATRLSQWVLGLALALSTLVVYLTVRSINDPLKRLARGTREIAGGNFDYRFDESRNDEFATLATSFNRMVAKLGQLDQLKKDFVAHVSHELKSPLVTMQETNQLLADEIPGPLNDKQRRLIELNLHGGRRLSSMISNLLDVSSLEAGGMTFDFKAEELVGMMRFVLTGFTPRAMEKKLQLRMIPSGGDSRIIAACDRDRTIQVLENLIDNAVKFSPREGLVTARIEELDELPPQMPERLRARVAVTSRNRTFVRVMVDDQGPGVPDGEKEAIFRKFHQASNTAKIGTGGVGLGLAICGEIVEAHGGAIWVTDLPGGGSCFHLLLPAPAAGRGASTGEERVGLPRAAL